jgi:hypothetical protein
LIEKSNYSRHPSESHLPHQLLAQTTSFPGHVAKVPEHACKHQKRNSLSLNDSIFLKKSDVIERCSGTSLKCCQVKYFLAAPIEFDEKI